MKMNDKVAWTMLDKNVMTGTVVGVGYDTFTVRRVDGGTCTVLQSRCRMATTDDVELAIEFFTNKKSDRLSPLT